VPTPNVSVVDFTYVPTRQTTIEEINEAVIAEADGPKQGELS
jgi:glyceraldehyde 3-phosphate dehydrogenase